MQEQYITRLKNIEAALYKSIPKKATAQWLEQTAHTPSAVLAPEFFQTINAPALELLERGGKRWRPLLMLLCCELAGGKEETILPLTPLVELAHNGSLILDDMEDKSRWRRGGEAIHLIYGEDMAINTGSYLYFLPTHLIDQSSLDEALKLRLYTLYHTALRRLHFGQGLDIQWHNNPDFIPQKEQYLQMCRFKTGSLSGLAAQTGTLIGGAGFELAARLAEAGETLGVAFQILDDVKNLTSGNPGKKRGDDIVEGKKSLPVILHARLAPDTTPSLRELLSTASSLGMEEGQEAIDQAIRLMEKSGSIARAKQEARELIESAKAAFQKPFAPSEPLNLLMEMIDSFL